MRVLTVQQPWAWAIIHGGKDVENRRQLWTYRGPVAIHAGARWSVRGEMSPLMRQAYAGDGRIGIDPTDFPLGAILGVVDLVDAHHAEPGCCASRWGEQSNHHADKIVHLGLANAREFTEPIRGRDGAHLPGRLGLWHPDADLADRIEAARA